MCSTSTLRHAQRMKERIPTSIAISFRSKIPTAALRRTKPLYRMAKAEKTPREEEVGMEGSGAFDVTVDDWGEYEDIIIPL